MGFSIRLQLVLHSWLMIPLYKSLPFQFTQIQGPQSCSIWKWVISHSDVIRGRGIGVPMINSWGYDLLISQLPSGIENSHDVQGVFPHVCQMCNPCHSGIEHERHGCQLSHTPPNVSIQSTVACGIYTRLVSLSIRATGVPPGVTEFEARVGASHFSLQINIERQFYHAS